MEFRIAKQQVDKKVEIWTRGKYKVIEVFKDDKIHFENLTILR